MKKQTQIWGQRKLQAQEQGTASQGSPQHWKFQWICFNCSPKNFGVLNLQLSSYEIPYIQQNISHFGEGNNKTHKTEINQKKKTNTKLWKKEIAKLKSAQVHMPQKTKTTFRCKSLLTHNI